jgi:hypothetical protein
MRHMPFTIVVYADYHAYSEHVLLIVEVGDSWEGLCTKQFFNLVSQQCGTRIPEIKGQTNVDEIH